MANAGYVSVFGSHGVRLASASRLIVEPRFLGGGEPLSLLAGRPLAVAIPD